MACTLVRGARGHKPRTGEEIPPLYTYCTQYKKHYANDADELECYGLFKKSKTHVAKPTALNPEPVYGITTMSDSTQKSQETLHDEHIIAVREEPILHLEPYQRDVTNVKRSGQWLNIESRNLVPGGL